MKILKTDCLSDGFRMPGNLKAGWLFDDLSMAPWFLEL